MSASKLTASGEGQGDVAGNERPSLCCHHWCTRRSYSIVCMHACIYVYIRVICICVCMSDAIYRAANIGGLTVLRAIHQYFHLPIVTV